MIAHNSPYDMRTIDQILQELIPPADHSHRNGFSNEHLILELTKEERVHVELRLIEMLKKTDDVLIGETLTILKSRSSLPGLRNRLALARSSFSKIIWASFINELEEGDEHLKEIVRSEFEKINDKYVLTSAFYYLRSFNDPAINDKIRSYINDADYLTAYNARQCLGIDTQKIIDRERAKGKDR